tara:strand:+ start:10501 stop:10902 length:402 start_codon:yes stop_codon:yes gene_type:complete
MKTKHAKLILAPSRDEGEWKSSSLMMMDILKCPSREIEFTTFDDLNAKALAFAMDKEAYTQARALEATENGTTKGIPGVQVQIQCLDARKPAGWKKATARPIYFFPDEEAEKADEKMADEIRKGNIIYLTCEK